MASPGDSITEGIGLGRVTPIIKDIKVDKPYVVPDDEALAVIFDLLEHEGLCVGGSTGINVAGAIRLAQGPGARPHDRDHPRRLRHALPVEALQSGIPEKQEIAGAGVAGAEGGVTGRLSEGVIGDW